MYFGNLPEEFLFIIIDDETESFAINNDQIIKFGLAGATLLELTIQGRISTTDDRIHIMDKTAVTDPIIQSVFESIKEEASRSTLYWIREISNRFDLKKELLKRLVEKELIEVKEEKKFIIFTTKKYEVVKPDFEKIIKQHIRDLLDKQEESNHRALGFLSLIYATGATGQIFTDDEIEDNIGRIRSLVADEEIGKSVAESIQIIIDALMRSQIVSYSNFML